MDFLSSLGAAKLKKKKRIYVVLAQNFSCFWLGKQPHLAFLGMLNLDHMFVQKCIHGPPLWGWPSLLSCGFPGSSPNLWLGSLVLPSVRHTANTWPGPWGWEAVGAATLWHGGAGLGFTALLCDFGQVTLPLWASMPSSPEWESSFLQCLPLSWLWGPECVVNYDILHKCEILVFRVADGLLEKTQHKQVRRSVGKIRAVFC